MRSLRLTAYTDSEDVGGAELSLGYLLGALATDISIAVLATDRKVGEAIAAHRQGTPVLTVPAPRGVVDVRALVEHVRALREIAPDIVHANQAWPWACGYGELAALLLPRTKVVAVDHLPLSGAIPRARRLGRRVLSSRLDAHVSVGESAAREIERVVGLRAGSVRAVPNGVPPAPASAASDARRSPTIVGSVGRLTEQKGYDLLLRVLPSIPDAAVMLVGDGPQRATLEAQASRLGVAERLEITGWVEDARDRLASFDIFALPSRWEGMPLAILEAMHAALPVVVSGVGSIREAVIDGDTGYVVAADDVAALTERLERLVADGELRAQMGRRGRELARSEHTATAMARRYEAIYSELAPWWRGRSN